MLLGNIGIIGLGTLLVGELPKSGANKGRLIASSLFIAVPLCFILGLLYAVFAPLLLPGFRSLVEGHDVRLLFALGVALTGAALILDEAVIGLLQGEIQLWRNGFFSFVKLIALYALGRTVTDDAGAVILLAWVAGLLISLVLLAIGLRIQGREVVARPSTAFIKKFRFTTLKHHALNLATYFPSYVLPILVTATLSAEVNARFYIAWLIAGFLYVIPAHFSVVLYAVGSENPLALTQKLRTTLRLSLALCTVGVLILLLGAPVILNLFGGSYGNASGDLRILALASLPMTIKIFYITIARIHQEIAKAAVMVALSGLLELLLAALGGHFGGLTGLCLGYLAALAIEVMWFTPRILRAAGRRALR